MFDFRLLLLLAGTFILLPGLAQAKVWQVSHSEDTGVAEIQKAFAMAEPGDEILIEAGVYIADSEATWETSPFLLSGKSDIVVRSEEGAYLLEQFIFSTPLTIENCDGVVFENIHFGHANTIGACAGGVIILHYSSNISFNGCVIHGSGSFAVEASVAKNVSFTECALVDCSSRGVILDECLDFTFTDCLFANNDQEYFEGGLFVDVSNLPIELTLHNCLIIDNHSKFLGLEEINIVDSIIIHNIFDERSEFDSVNGIFFMAIDEEYHVDLSLSMDTGPRTDTAANNYIVFQGLDVYTSTY